MQNEPQSGGENEYFGNENNAFFGESAKTYFTPRWKAQKERDRNSRRFNRFKPPQRPQQGYNRLSSRD